MSSRGSVYHRHVKGDERRGWPGSGQAVWVLQQCGPDMGNNAGRKGCLQEYLTDSSKKQGYMGKVKPDGGGP